jgi:hypothetical protein
MTELIPQLNGKPYGGPNGPILQVRIADSEVSICPLGGEIRSDSTGTEGIQAQSQLDLEPRWTEQPGRLSACERARPVSGHCLI